MLCRAEVENWVCACGRLGKVICFNKWGWGHAWDLGQWERSQQLNLGSGVKSHLSEPWFVTPPHHPKTCRLIASMRIGGKVQGQKLLILVSCITLAETSWGETLVGGSQENSTVFDLKLTDIQMGFPPTLHSGSWLTNPIHLNAGSQPGCWVSESLHGRLGSCSNPADTRIGIYPRTQNSSLSY